MRDYDPLNDKVFEQVMSDREICEAFVNAVMLQIGKLREPVVIQEIRTQEEVVTDILHARRMRMDVKARDIFFTIYDLEAQAEYALASHKSRSLYYAAGNIFNQLRAGDRIEALSQVYIIFINKVNKESERAIDVVNYRYDDTNELYSGLCNIVEINLDNISRVIDAYYKGRIREKPFNDALFVFLSYFYCGDSAPKFEAVCRRYRLQNTELRNRLTILMDSLIQNVSLKEKIDFFSGYYQNNEEVLPVSLLEVYEMQGIEKGIEQGIEQGALPFVLTLLREGESVETISKRFSVPQTLIEKIAEEADICKNA